MVESPASIEAAFIGALTHAAGAVALIALFLLLIGRIRGQHGILMLAAIAVSAAWTAAAAAYFAGLWDYPGVIAGFEIARDLGWILFLSSLVGTGYFEGRHGIRRLTNSVLAILVVFLVGVLLTQAVTPARPVIYGSVTPNSVLALTLAVVGIFLTEILFRNVPPDERWRIKFICLATGMIFAYDLFLFADANLFGKVDPILRDARGAIQALAAPLLAASAARNKIWLTRIVISRQVVLGSTTLVASGLYLFAAAVIGYLLRESDQTRGPVVQVIFFVGAMAVLMLVLSSGTYWAHAKGFINRHFYRHKYDWREEWLRFMRTLSTGQSAAPLDERSVKAIADIVESPGGAMWLLKGGHCEQACSWNFSELRLSQDQAGRVTSLLTETRSVLDVGKVLADSGSGDAGVVSDLLATAARAWLIVPLWHRSLVGFAILARPRASRVLDWEDYDLLNVAGRQAASYLAEQQAVEALEDVREFEIFNRRFAFVIHDVKNLVSQLSVLGTNFEKYGHREEFRDDVVSTLKDASAKMKRLMERIHSFQPRTPAGEPQALDTLLRRVIGASRAPQGRVEFDGAAPAVAVAGDLYRLEAVFGHLVQNAIEAVGGEGNVRVSLRREGPTAIVDVSDDGPGMGGEFIRRELFKPFQSTKKQGMGIGAYQCRELARELGGNLEAVSVVGQGTTMRVTLPISEPA